MSFTIHRLPRARVAALVLIIGLFGAGAPGLANAARAAVEPAGDHGGGDDHGAGDHGAGDHGAGDHGAGHDAAADHGAGGGDHAAGHGGGIEFITPIVGGSPSGKTGLLWILINFGVLLLILDRLLFIPLRRQTRETHDRIKKELAHASAARAAAEELIGEYRERVSRLDDEVAEVLDDARARAEADRRRIIADAEAEAAAIATAARTAAEVEALRLQRRLEAEVVDRALAKAETALRSAFGEADQRRAIDGYVAQVARTDLGGPSRGPAVEVTP